MMSKRVCYAAGSLQEIEVRTFDVCVAVADGECVLGLLHPRDTFTHHVHHPLTLLVAHMFNDQQHLFRRPRHGPGMNAGSAEN